MKNYKKILALAACVLVLSACQNTSQENTSAENQSPDGPVTIGGIVALTGDAAVYGDMVSTVANLRVKQINEQGGIDGRPIEIIWEDGKCNPSDASKAAQKLINIDQVNIILGGACSGETLGAAPITEKNQVILFSSTSSSPEVTEAGDFVFRTAPSDSSQGKVLAQHANAAGYQKVGMLVEQSDYSVAIAQTFSQHFEGEIVKEGYLSTESDFKTRITKLKNAGIEALFLDVQSPPKAEILLKQLLEQDFIVPLIFNEAAAADAVFTENNAEALSQFEVVGGNFVAPDNEKLQTFLAAYEAEYGEKANFVNYTATTVDAVDIIKEVIMEVGNDQDTQAIRDAMYAIKDRDGMYEGLTFDEHGDVNITHSLFRFNPETNEFELVE